MVFLQLLPIGDIIKAHIIQAFKTPSGSMLPTLQIGDHLLVDKSDKARKSVKSGEIIVFKYPEDPKRDFIKRVIGVEGDVIESRNKTVYVNGKALNEPYVEHTDISADSIEPRDTFGPVVVPKGTFFVMGDNRDQSYDSRYWGYVPIAYVKGKIFKIYWSWDSRASRVRWDRVGKKVT
ncbi:MAG TPA: signal peptidase I [Nitrospiraceae bacterium]|nr:signal peptidase I [Nitrospiraceae bacterium]